MTGSTVEFGGTVNMAYREGREKVLRMTRRKLCHQSQGVPSLSKSSRQNVGVFGVKTHQHRRRQYFKTPFQNFSILIAFETFKICSFLSVPYHKNRKFCVNVQFMQ